MSATSLYRTVNTAWTEGRLENILQRQKELSALHANVKKSSSALIAGFTQELSATEQNASEEVRRSLDIIKRLYDSLDFPSGLARERDIKSGKSVPEDLVPIGPSLIDPDPQLPISSTLVPLAAAVSAGSAAVVLAPSSDSSSTTAQLLRKIVRESLDFEAFAVTGDASPETRQQLGSQYFAVAVLQNKDTRDGWVQHLTRTNPSVRILVPPSGLPAVFVDRSAENLEAVAAHVEVGILRGPRRDATRTPRIAFVDEFVMGRLANLLNGATTTIEKPVGASDMSGKDSQTLQAKLASVFPSLGTKAPSLVVQLSSKDPLTPDNINTIARHLTANTREIMLVPVTSLDDGIDLLNKVNGRAFSPAVHVFGDSKSSFYIGKFTNSLSVFINHLAADFNVPASPSSPAASFNLPYHRQDFSVGKSVLQVPLTYPDDSAFNPAAHRLNLGKVSQPKGGSMSYFEQGLLVGLAVIIATVSGVSYLGIRVVKYYLK